MPTVVTQTSNTHVFDTYNRQPVHSVSANPSHCHCVSSLNCSAPEFIPQSSNNQLNSTYNLQPLLQVSNHSEPVDTSRCETAVLPNSLQDTNAPRCEAVSHNNGVDHNRSTSNDHVDTFQTQQINELVKSFCQLVNINRLPLPEPGIFTGDPLDYPSWKNSFSTLIESRNIAPAERIHYLKRYLGGKAKQCVESFLLMPTTDSYNEALSLIDKRFGDDFSIAQAFKRKIDAWPKISGRDYSGLRNFSDFLRQCEVAYRHNASLRILDDDLQNRAMLLKLPDWIVSRWAREVHRRKQENRFPTFSEFVKFLCNETDIVCEPITMHSVNNDKKSGSVSGADKKVSTTSAIVHNTIKAKLHCIYCDKDNHQLERCKSLQSKSLQEKKDFITKKGLCFGCLRNGHLAKDCKKRLECHVCKKTHPTVMHSDTKHDRKSVDKSQSAESKETKHVSLLTQDGTVSRSTMVVPVYLSHVSKPDSEILTYALLDTQSDTSFISETLFEKLGVDGTPTILKLSTMTADGDVMTSKRVKGLTVRGFECDSGVPLPVVFTHSSIPAQTDCIPTPNVANHWPYLRPIVNHLMPKTDCPIGVLIGYNCPRALMPREVIPSVGDGPFAQRTDLGWGIVGPTGKLEDDEFHHVCSKVSGSFIALRTSAKEVINPQDLLQFFGREEGYVHNKNYSQEDTRFISLMESSISKQDGHYMMPLPWRDVNSLPEDNKSVALSRLKSLTKQFTRKPEYFNHYKAFMTDLLDKGYAEVVSESEEDNPAYYLPHHGVYNPSKPGKLRVVMDASAKYKGRSLNDYLLTGPDLMNTLVGVLSRFRKDRVAVMCDIQGMFYQFLVPEKDRDFLRFLWFKDHDYNSEIIVLRSTVHLFGIVCSPAVANFGLKQAALDGKEQYGPAVADFIDRHFYVDDGLISTGTEAEAIDLIKKSISLCRSSGLTLHKFVCNSMEVLDAIPSEFHANDLKETDFIHEHLPIQRALGVSWCIESDTLQFRVIVKNNVMTRRGILSTVSSVFDPLGLIAPVVLRGKNILQAMCRDKLGWDDPLPEYLRNLWERWILELPLLENIKVNRCFKPAQFSSVIKSVQLHCFADACFTGYAACAYLRIVDENNKVHCTLVQAKSRVAPLRTPTIPRLELSGAVLAVEISKLLQAELDYVDIESHYWTDSKIVLGFISNETKRFHVYVANRIKSIREESDPNQWHHVSSEDNAADVASRGCNATELVESGWFQGPSFLWNKEVDFSMEQYDLDDSHEEIKSSACLSVRSDVCDQISLAKFSSWNKARRIIAFCFLFIHNCRSKCRRELSASDIQNAEKWMVSKAQHDAFSEEISQLSSEKSVPEEIKQTSQTGPIC
jgi:hypothetical protein